MLLLVKYGGNAMTDLEADPVLADCVSLINEDHRVVLVHGGGPAIDAALKERGIVEKRLEDVVEAVLCATVNKALVRALCALGVAAVGLSGEDNQTLVARPAAPVNGESLGFVGEVERVNAMLVESLLDHRFVPVVAPLGVAADGSTAYNINGDTAAGALAGALRADAFIAITDVSRIRRNLDDPKTEVARLSIAEVDEWKAAGVIAGGMLPKVNAAVEALRRGAKRAIVAGAGTGAVRAALAGAGTELLLG
jgi:acetylglutamate kinase